MSSLTHRAAGATLWSTIEIASRFAMQFSVTVILARVLSPNDFGLIAMILVFTSIGTLLIDSGFGTALIQRRAVTDDDETTVFLFSLVASISISTLLCLFAPALAAFYDEPSLVRLVYALSIALPLGALGAVPDALLTIRLDFRSRAKAEIVSSISSGVIAIALAACQFGVWSLVWQVVTATGLRTILLWTYSTWRPRGHFQMASFRQLSGFGGYIFLANLLNTISIRMQSLLIGHMFDSRTLGYYTLAQNTQQAPAQFMSGVLNRVGLPVFSAIADQPAKLVGALRLSLRLATFVFMPCMVGIAVIAKPLIVTLYGERWAPAAPLLSILSISAMLWPLHVLNLAAIAAQGRSNLVFRLEVIKRLVSITLILICSSAGPIAIAWAVLASSLLGVVLNTWYTNALLGYGLPEQLRDQCATLVLSAVAALAAWLASHWIPAGATAIGSAVLAAGVAYLGSAALWRHAALRDVLLLFRELRVNQPRAPTLRHSDEN